MLKVTAPKVLRQKNSKFFVVVRLLLVVSLIAIIVGLLLKNKSASDFSSTQGILLASTQAELQTIEDRLASASATIEKLLAEDQRVRNNQLEATISAIQKTYTE
ncbi:MAG TPA: hypothetical protein PKH60_04100, partial [Candidatus Woesebacteria bacterium]|nr:hypothetical protein [Candidatus Woesebacteria bacterium]